MLQSVDEVRAYNKRHPVKRALNGMQAWIVLHDYRRKKWYGVRYYKFDSIQPGNIEKPEDGGTVTAIEKL